MEVYARKAADAIAKALNLLDEAGDGGPEYEVRLWQAASELEYASSITSMVYKLADQLPEVSKSNPGKDAEANPLDVSKELLREALKVMNSTPKDGYLKVRKALNLVRKELVRVSGK